MASVSTSHLHERSVEKKANKSLYLIKRESLKEMLIFPSSVFFFSISNAYAMAIPTQLSSYVNILLKNPVLLLEVRILITAQNNV